MSKNILDNILETGPERSCGWVKFTSLKAYAWF